MDDQDLELDSESGDTGTPGSQSLLVRKNISLKLKGKGRGRGRLKTPRSKKGTGYLKKSNLDDEVEDDHNENDENIPSKFVIEEDISKLEAPTFTTIDRGPPEPMHRNTKLKWDHRQERLFLREKELECLDYLGNFCQALAKVECVMMCYGVLVISICLSRAQCRYQAQCQAYTVLDKAKVNLIGEKVPNPMIHCCEKCLLPILIYGRMIPCKHVFCLDCAKKTEKVCPRCNDKVQRVEQTGLGTVFMCTYGGSRHGSDGCRRTYLSSRDLQAHINHRHLRAPPPHHEAPSQTQSSVAIHHVQQAPQPQTATPAQAHHVSDYENRDPRELRNLHEPPPLRSVLPSHHQNVDLHNPHHVPMVHPSHPPPPIQHPPPHDNSAVLPPPPHDALRTNYHPRDDTHPPAHLPPRPHLQYSQLPPVTAPPLSHGYASPIPVMSTRTNLITVPIQDDTSPGYHSPHQAQYHPPQPHHQPPQPSSVGYPQQHPPPPQHPYSHPPPTHPHSLPVSYTTPASQPPIVYSNPIAAPAFSQPPPPTHFPPPIHPHSTPGGGTPSMYNNPPPVHHPPPSHPQYSGQRFTPPQPPQYDDSHLSSPPYSQGGPHSGWASQPSRGPPPPRPLGPNSNPNLGPLQPRPPYYHQ